MGGERRRVEDEDGVKGGEREREKCRRKGSEASGSLGGRDAPHDEVKPPPPGLGSSLAVAPVGPPGRARPTWPRCPPAVARSQEPHELLSHRTDTCTKKKIRKSTEKENHEKKRTGKKGTRHKKNINPE